MIDDESPEPQPEMKGLGWRVSLSILVSIGWLVFLVLWLFFYAKQYPWEKNFAIFLLSIFLLVLIVGAPWAIWGLRFRSPKEKELWSTTGFRWRLWVSCIFILVVFLFLIYWFWSLAQPYDIYQNIAIFIVSIMIMGGILAALWAPWGIKHSHKFAHARYEEEKKP